MTKGEAESVGKFRRAIEHDEDTLKTNDIYTPANVKKYGKLVPAVCGLGDIRISRPEILHGSTKVSRRVVVVHLFEQLMEECSKQKRRGE